MAHAAQRRHFARSITGAALIVAAALPTAAGRAQGGDAPPAKDTIFARKTVMDTIGSNMDQLEEMLEPGGKLDVADAREHLDTISVLLQTFPHLFPAATNQWQAGAIRDPAYDTFAAPAILEQFS
jgi:cytochrome c556